jgi:glycine/D-amino acid oxidase-like deaminating enzyme
MDLKSNEPFWLVKNGLIDSYPSLHSEEECDVLVVGAGITGSLVAHQCIKDGYKTIVLDRREVCNGSTSATTSMLQYEIDVPLYELIEKIGEEGAVQSYEACSRAIDQLEKIAKSIKSEAGFVRKKSLYFASKKKDVNWLRKEYETRKKTGFVLQWLTAEAILERYGLSDTFGGILSEQGASLDAFRMAHELLIYNQQKGLKIFDKTALSTVKYKQDYVLAHTDRKHTIKARKIIYCIGYESKQLIKENFVQLKSTYAIVSEINKKAYQKLAQTLIWNTSEPYLYMRTTDDGRFLIGGGDEDFRNPDKRDALLGKKEKELLKSLKKIKPDLPFDTDFVWAGTFGETKDGLPYIGEHKKFKHSYFVLGFGGNGITFSVTGMEMVALWLQGKRHTLTPYFSFGR